MKRTDFRLYWHYLCTIVSLTKLHYKSWWEFWSTCNQKLRSVHFCSIFLLQLQKIVLATMRFVRGKKTYTHISISLRVGKSPMQSRADERMLIPLSGSDITFEGGSLRIVAIMNCKTGVEYRDNAETTANEVLTRTKSKTR